MIHSKSKLRGYILSCASLLFVTTSLHAKEVNEWPEDDVAFCNLALDQSLIQYDKFRQEYKNPTKIPTSFSNGKTNYTTPLGWTSGFVAGSYWYLYEHSKDPIWLEEANRWTDALEKTQFNRKTHDIGFIIDSSFGNRMRFTNSPDSAAVMISAAQTLMERYNPKVGVTYSWSFGTWEFPVIIDNMMNLELLFKASLLSKDTHYYDAAVSHAKVTMKHHFRDDYSSYHLVNYSRNTGLPIEKQTVQGITDNSSWSRGQAWAAYGYTMTYRYTQDESFLNQAKGIVEFMLTNENMPEDLIPYFDYDAPAYSDIVNYRDSSAAALLASALLELAQYVENEQATYYRDNALTILRNLSTPTYFASEDENGHFLLKQATGHYPANRDLNASLNYGDYYYLEALNRCKSI
ncbi:glycoside hydrolase family 88 protein [Photobacterium sp. ZSDE20]|uniref:Glycoside hydrolase family 88 protein n=1 Tax=Photobacterium pectinilyticum TaxID=2906793 RepID=A0ABT1NCK4_9GAMM|nr:glycoside hydrolase family 88 protein [Photobacterium sp. ZSDE20]MCQ1061391.1 glycoside hydrolase family 88 protein [Photobacterium sp. ZSDE20]MDD1830141.1 glycoside hydrolase family 88 protein [Photobacterium sp. ZSDE20]